MFATHNNDEDLVITLLEFEPNLEITDKFGKTACERTSNTRIQKILLEHLKQNRNDYAKNAKKEKEEQNRSYYYSKLISELTEKAKQDSAKSKEELNKFVQEEMNNSQILLQKIAFNEIGKQKNRNLAKSSCECEYKSQDENLQITSSSSIKSESFHNDIPSEYYQLIEMEIKKHSEANRAFATKLINERTKEIEIAIKRDVDNKIKLMNFKKEKGNSLIIQNEGAKVNETKENSKEDVISAAKYQTDIKGGVHQTQEKSKELIEIENRIKERMMRAKGESSCN